MYLPFILFLGLLSLLYIKKRLHLHVPGCSIFDPIDITHVNIHTDELSAKYGPVYRIWNGLEAVIVIADYDIAMKYYADHISHVRDVDFSLGNIVKSMLSDAIGTKYGSAWTKHRKALKFMISAKFIESKTQMISTLCKDYINTILKDDTIDIKSTMDKFTIKIIARVIYGDMSRDDHDELMRCGNLHARLMSMSPSSKETSSMNKQFKSAWYAFNRRMVANVKPFTGLYHIVNSDLAHHEILSNLDEIVLFNIDVMYSAIGGLLVNLAKNPTYQTRLYEELKSCDDIHSNKLLNDVINESARLSPSLYLSFPERAHKARKIGDYVVEAGTIVLVDAKSINSRFADSDKFLPERRQEKFHRFGLGPRKCLGYRLADTILREMLNHVVKRVELLPPKNEVGVKKEGMPFFSPYLEFPNIDVKYRSAVLCGISLGNSHYDQANIDKIFTKWSGRCSKLITFIPDTPSIHTLLAKNPSANIDAITRKCRLDSSALHNRSKRAVVGKDFEFVSIKWDAMVGLNTIAFGNSMYNMIHLYQTNKEFRSVVQDTTREVIGVGGNLEEGIMFLVKELSFLVAAPEIIGCDSVIYSYHREFQIVDDVVSGKLGHPRVDNVYTRVVA